MRVLRWTAVFVAVVLLAAILFLFFGLNTLKGPISRAVEKSTGFGPPERDAVELPADAQRLADRCRPYYERLAAFRIV